MSAGRKKADPLDRYDTPQEPTRALLSALQFPPVYDILEPAAGRGAIVQILAEHFPLAEIDAGDIEPRAEGIVQTDFLEDERTEAYDLIITNPPFRLAEQFLRQSMRCVRINGHVVLLLRAAFLETKRRRNLLEEFPPTRVYFLRNRPKFTGPNSDGATTDTAMYAWFIWRKGERPDHFEGRIL